MKKLKGIILVAAFAFAGVFCDGGSGFLATGEGGPDVTPEEIVEQVGDIEIAEAKDVLAAVQDQIEQEIQDYEGPEEADDAAGEDVGEAAGEDQGEVIAKEEGDVEEEEVIEEQVQQEPEGEVATEIEGDAAEEAEEDIEEEEVDIAGMTVELDPTAGRWFKVEEKELPGLSKGDVKSVKNRIKEYRNALKDLRKDLSEAKKDSGKDKDRGKDKDKGKDKRDTADIQAKIDRYLALIKEERNKVGYGSTQKGIYTYWANEDLILMVRNVEVEGWYRLRIVAMNYGTLPEWYDQFNVAVVNETEGADAGGISIKASDSRYYRGSLLVYLEKGDTDLNLLWKNDAYKENAYDANIQIKRVTMRYASKNNKGLKRLVRNAHEYTTVDGRFFWDKKTAWTNWANQTIGFSFPELEAGKYEITVMAKNYGPLPLPDGYDNFVVVVDADGTSGEAMVSAAQKSWRKGNVVLDLTGGTDIFLTWINNQYKEGDYDTNIQYKKIFLKRVGDSERSALAAYLLGTRSGNRVLMTGILVVLVGFIALISVWNRRRAKSQI